MVYEGLSDCGDMEKARIEAKLATLDDKLVKRRGEWNQNHDWVWNAEEEHGKHPFSGIIAQSNPRGSDNVMIGDELDESNSVWKVSSQVEVPREPESMASALDLLLGTAREVVFIDPHFSPSRARYRDTLIAFLKRTRLFQGHEVDVEYHLGDAWDSTAFRRACEQKLQELLPSGAMLTFFMWREKEFGERLHDRFILTDRGGVAFPGGLDSGQKGQMATILLLEKAVWSSMRQRYNYRSESFEAACDPVCIRAEN